MFQTMVVENIKHNFMFCTLFTKIVPLMR